MSFPLLYFILSYAAEFVESRKLYFFKGRIHTSDVYFPFPTAAENTHLYLLHKDSAASGKGIGRPGVSPVLL